MHSLSTIMFRKNPIRSFLECILGRPSSPGKTTLHTSTTTLSRVLTHSSPYWNCYILETQFLSPLSTLHRLVGSLTTAAKRDDTSGFSAFDFNNNDYDSKHCLENFCWF